MASKYSNQLPNVWGEGALFASSGYDAATDYSHPVVGRLLEGRFGLSLMGPKKTGEIHLGPSLEVEITSGDPAEARALKPVGSLGKTGVATGDRLYWKTGPSSSVEIWAVSAHVFCFSASGLKKPKLLWKEVHGSWAYSWVGPHMTLEAASGAADLKGRGMEFFLVIKPSSKPTGKAIPPGLSFAELKKSLAAAKKRHQKFWQAYRAPAGLSENLQVMDAKAASILRVNTESAQGLCRRRWTTPDRFPHRQMWIWDSAFHALGWKHLDQEMARDAIFAVLERVHKNGFIPISMDPLGDRMIHESQPPILGWALDRVLPVEKMRPADRNWAYPRLAAFLGWMLLERRGAKRGLLGWYKDEKSVNCRCGESGWDNSTRFDQPGPDDHIDLVSFVANDLVVLARMARAMNRQREATQWEDKRQALVDRVNELMWCEEDGLYYDLDQKGRFVKVKSAACFYPLAAGIPSPLQAARLRENLMDPKLFATKVPVPSISPSEKAFVKDMWRGPMWVNSNYLIADGLRQYGYDKDARTLSLKTLAEMERWYRRIGVLCEYYDCDGKEDPRFQLRKASRTEGIRVIRDYGWTASLAMALAREL